MQKKSHTITGAGLSDPSIPTNRNTKEKDTGVIFILKLKPFSQILDAM